ncbi:MAG TPA: FAD-binding oxidoreductase [Polyangiaceae bacterium]|nr:FAD-binding oxidoreductase [Polyangiaceae bacterium]
MVLDRDQLRWNGWGWKHESFELSEARRQSLVQALSARFGVTLSQPPPAVPIDRVVLSPSRLGDAARAALEAALGKEQVLLDTAERAYHAAGKSFPDLLRIRDGKLDRAPDAVVYPASSDQVARVLDIAREHAVAVVPFGGGTSVVGGVDPILPPGKHAVIALDTTRLDRLIGIDDRSLTATFQAGIDGPSLEAELGDRGYTLGHFPQSFEHSTLGGWIAARSSGQLSDGYGGIDALLVSAKVVTPRGELTTLTVPRHATGPDLKEIVLGSEGTLGVIVEATVRIRLRLAVQDVRGMLFRDFASGIRTIRAWAAAGLPMMMMRLSDARETELSLMLRHDPGKRFDAGTTLLDATKSVGYGEERAIMLFGFEGDDRTRLAALMLRAQAIGVLQGGLPLGKGPGASWKKERFRTPYLRDFFLDQGIAIDTMETAFEWSKLEQGHTRVLSAMRAATERHAGGGLAMGHVSHSYPDGACLYFIVLYPIKPSDAVQQWREIKRATTDAIVDAGGTVSHHHGIGTDHAPWLAREKGVLGIEALRALKQTFDPEGMMNPGKLF